MRSFQSQWVIDFVLYWEPFTLFESIFGVHYLLSSLVADYFSQRNVSLDCAREVDLNDKYSS